MQSDLNQLYKQIQISQTTGEFAAEDTAQINTLLSNVSIGSYDTSNGFPLIIAASTSWQTGETSYGIAGVSKSGKVFYVSKTTGGVTRSITDWSQYKLYAQEDITSYSELLTNDEHEFSQEDKDWFGEYITQRQNDLQTYTQNEAQGKDIWSLIAHDNPSNCPQDPAHPDRICIWSYQVPLNSTNTYNFGGYVYDVASSKWIQIWGAWAD